jgi:hypothetical protein
MNSGALYEDLDGRIFPSSNMPSNLDEADGVVPWLMLRQSLRLLEEYQMTEPLRDVCRCLAEGGNTSREGAVLSTMYRVEGNLGSVLGVEVAAGLMFLQLPMRRMASHWSSSRLNSNGEVVGCRCGVRRTEE